MMVVMKEDDVSCLVRSVEALINENMALRAENTRARDEAERLSGYVATRGVESLNLSVRATSCLETLGIRSVEELTGYTAAQLLRTRNFGRRSIREINEKLGKIGLCLKGAEKSPT